MIKNTYLYRNYPYFGPVAFWEGDRVTWATHHSSADKKPVQSSIFYALTWNSQLGSYKTDLKKPVSGTLSTGFFRWSALDNLS